MRSLKLQKPLQIIPPRIQSQILINILTIKTPRPLTIQKRKTALNPRPQIGIARQPQPKRHMSEAILK